MRLSAGTRLGPYEIVSELGAGGMGEVYRARDTRLNREVAVKVLSMARDVDPAFQSRFEREAQALAALNHPHIASIYDVIDADDHRAIVMELVTGRTLAQQIASGPLPLRSAIGYGIDISDALSVAHAAGIVHRDLKPANVVITESGSAKVLDFGIAKWSGEIGAEAAGSIVTAAVTGEHALIGTVGYMSPEQAHGRLADARSDIFSLGVVLYEAISGRTAFAGDSAVALLSAVLRDDPPPLRAVVPSTPRSVERCVMRCLEKDPRRRYQHAADLKVALEDLRDDLAAPEPVHTSTAHAAGAAGTAPIARRLLPPTLYAAAGFAIATLVFIVAGGPRSAAILSPRYRPFITEVTSADYPAWSPDGRTLAYVDQIDGEPQIFVRGVDSARSTPVTKEAVGAPPFWSPDGSRIYFIRARDGNLVSVGAAGGEPQVVAGGERGNGAAGRTGLACISPDGRSIVLARGAVGAVELWVLETSTRVAHVLNFAGMTRPLAIVQALAFSPDGKTLAVVASTTALNQARGVWLIPWPSGSARLVLGDAPYLTSGASIAWMPDNRRLLMSGSPLHGGTSRLLLADTATGTVGLLTGGKDTETSPAISPDATRIAFVTQRSGLDLIQFPIDGGPPEPLLATSRSEFYPDVSASGLLAYITDADGSPAVRLRSAGDTSSRAISGEAGELERTGPPGEVRLSPDGQRAAVGTYGTAHLIWIYPTAGGTPVRLDSESTDQHGPSWSPDGNWIAYRRMINGSWSIVKTPLGGGAAMRLDEANPGGAATDWSPDGRWIAHVRQDGMHLISPDGAETRVLAGLRSGAFRFSRDGSRIFAARRGDHPRWELAIWDVAAGRELRVVPLPLSSAADLQWLAVSSDGQHIIVSAGTNTSDVWLLEQFKPPSRWWAHWLR